MTVVTGLIDAGDVLANELPVDMSDLVHKRQNDSAEFRTMLEKIGSKPATAKKVEWLEEDLIPRVSALAASATSADTSFTVTSGEGNTVFAVNDVARIVETDEGILITAVGANAVTATRAWGGVAAASASSASKILIVGNVSAAGASSGTARYQKRVAGFNYLSDQRNVFSFTDLTTGIKHYSGSEPEAEMVRKMDEHSRACETTLFYGARDVDLAASPGERGSCGGALEFISTNVLDVSGTGGDLSASEFELFLEDPYGVSGRGNKVFFAAPRVATVLSQLYRDKWVPATAGNNSVFGAKVTAFIHATYGMEIPVVVKREWHDLDKTGTGYGTNGFLLDLDHIRLRVLDGRYNILRKNLQEPSSTQVTLEYRSVYSLEFGVEEAHGLVRGVTSLATS